MMSEGHPGSSMTPLTQKPSNKLQTVICFIPFQGLKLQDLETMLAFFKYSAPARFPPSFGSNTGSEPTPTTKPPGERWVVWKNGIDAVSCFQISSK